MTRFRVFLSEQDELPAGVEIEERYSAFAIVATTDQIAEEIRQRYPVERLKSPSPPPTVPTVADLATVVAEAPARGPYTVVVRFRAPVRRDWVAAVEAAGAVSHGPIGSTSLVVSCPNKATVKRLRELPSVEQVSDYVPTIRLSPASLQQLTLDAAAIDSAVERVSARPESRPSSYNTTLPGIIIANFFTDAYKQRALRALKRMKVRDISGAGSTGLSINLRSSHDPTAVVRTLATAPGLRNLEEKALKRPFNDIARRVIADEVVTSPGLGLTGAGEIVAIADTGLDTGDAATIHADFRGRVREIRSYPIVASLSPLLNNPNGDDGAADRFSGHGTHVSGSVLGDGTRSDAVGLSTRIAGTAPGAELVFQAVEQTTDWNAQGVLLWLQHGQTPPSHGLFGIPDDFADLLQPAFDQGARIHSDSWGGGVPGAYDEQCRQLDQFIWDHEDFLVVVAAGNAGQDISPQGQGIDLTSVDSPGTAKNCLTVGASENNRAGEFSEAYGAWWPYDYPVDPFKSDPMADSVDDIVAFSSRGPCTTGRRKPDVVAPGTFVLSVRSSQIASNQFAWGAFPPAKADYMFMGGTSMATPLVSGCAAVVRQYLRQTVGITDPSAALLKASIIHSARYVPYRFAHPSSAPYADNEQGWGRIDLRSVLNPQPPANVVFIDEPGGLVTGEEHVMAIEVEDDSLPLRITLVYTDFAGGDLVNNLNLMVRDPNSTHFLGNDFAALGTVDSVNNVEGVIVERPIVGAWTLRVVASDVPEGPQRFALVVSGGGVTRSG
jgi:subtilisin family serine protease